LRALAQDLRLTGAELTALMLAGVVEEDIRFGSLFAALQEPLAARRPCLGLIAALSSIEDPQDELRDSWAAVQRLVQCGLVVAANQTAPRAEWVLRVRALRCVPARASCDWGGHPRPGNRRHQSRLQDHFPPEVSAVKKAGA